MQVNKLSFYQYKQCNSKEIIDNMEEDYFKKIDELCQEANADAMKLKSIINRSQNNLDIDIYVNLSVGLIADIKECIKIRREEILPYVEELSGKVTDGHDCSNCSGGCAIKHSSKVPIIQSAHVRTKEMFNTLERVAHPFNDELPYSQLYRELRDKMQMLLSLVLELFYMEESILIPKILLEQKNIHVSH